MIRLMNGMLDTSPSNGERDQPVISRGEFRHLKLMESAVAHAPEAILAIDWTNGGAQLSITFVNDAFTRIFGYTREEAIGRNPTMLCGPSTDRDVVKKALEKVVTDGGATFDVVHYRKDGMPINVQIDVIKWIDINGTVTGTVSYIREHKDQYHEIQGDREARRLTALHSYNILDTPSEPEYDAVTALIAKLCEVPIALVSLVDENRQWFKSNCGLTGRDATGRDIAFCSHAIEQASILVIKDTLLDRRFVNNPLVVGEPHLRFYAGAPLIDQDGMALGTLCIADYVPRELTVEQWSNLGRLAKSITNLIMTRKSES